MTRVLTARNDSSSVMKLKNIATVLNINQSDFEITSNEREEEETSVRNEWGVIEEGEFDGKEDKDPLCGLFST